MAEDTEKQPPEQEIREKLKQLRATYTRSKKLVAEIETTHTRFTKFKDALADKDNGVQANLAWVKEQKKQITSVLKDADEALVKLQTTSSSIDTQIADMTTQYGSFQQIAEKVFSEDDGLQALHDAAKKLRDSISKYDVQASEKVVSAQTHLDDIAKKNQDMTTAYDEFLKIKTKIDDPESGLEALLRKATEYADGALKAKTSAESELASVIKLRDDSGEIVEALKVSRTNVETFEKESMELTDDIRNTLNKASSFSLSQALLDRTRNLNRQLILWGIAQFISIAALIIGLGLVFYALYLQGADTSSEVTSRLQNGPTLISVVSKILFTAPLAFAVYFTTSNFSHVRDLRDKYAWKETVAKNLQNYVKTLRDEFEEDQYKQPRFTFVINTVTGIYKEPNPSPKKKKYNFGINRVFNLGIEEEDLKELEKVIEDGVEEIVSDKVSESKKDLGSSITESNNKTKSSPKKPKDNSPTV